MKNARYGRTHGVRYLFQPYILLHEIRHVDPFLFGTDLQHLQILPHRSGLCFQQLHAALHLKPERAGAGLDDQTVQPLIPDLRPPVFGNEPVLVVFAAHQIDGVS